MILENYCRMVQSLFMQHGG